MQMNGYTYDRIDTKQRECGLIAQELLPVLPEVVHTSTQNDKYTVSYGNLAAVFVEAFKVLQSKIVSLEARVRELEGPTSL